MIDTHTARAANGTARRPPILPVSPAPSRWGRIMAAARDLSEKTPVRLGLSVMVGLGISLLGGGWVARSAVDDIKAENSRAISALETKLEARMVAEHEANRQTRQDYYVSKEMFAAYRLEQAQRQNEILARLARVKE